MSRPQTTIALLLLVIPLLLLPLQGHARGAHTSVAMPCAMHHHGMQDAQAMDAVQAEHPCDTGSPCGAQCQNCAGCAHCPVGIVLGVQAPLPRLTPTSYTFQSGQSFSSITLFKDHPPPRVG